MLTAIICIPLVTALLLAFVPGNLRFLFRLGALAATLATMLLATLMFWQFQGGLPGYQFEYISPWIEGLRINYHVGVAGLNVALIFMGGVVAFAAACVSW